MYLRSFLIILVLISFNEISLPQSKNTLQVEINNLQLTYRYFNEITPTIENKSGRKIYSFNVGWGLQLLRFNETTRQWEKGRLGFRCGLTGLNAATESRHPINPSEKLSLPVNWQLARGWDEKKDERAFLLADGKQRPYFGRYRLLFQYAYENWTNPLDEPAKAYAVESSEFIIIP